MLREIWLHNLRPFLVTYFTIVNFDQRNSRKLITFAFVNFIRLICLINSVAQLFLIQLCKLYSFLPGPHNIFKYTQHNHIRCQMMGGTILYKLTCSWRVNLFYYQHWTGKQKKITYRMLVNYSTTERQSEINGFSTSVFIA